MSLESALDEERREVLALLEGKVGSVRPALAMLLETLAQRSDRAFLDKTAEARRDWDSMLDGKADPQREGKHIHPQALARTLPFLHQHI